MFSYSRYELVYIDIEQKTGKERHEFGIDIEDAQNIANLVTILSKRRAQFSRYACKKAIQCV